MALQHYRELIGWQKSIDFTEQVYIASRRFPREELFGLTSQLRRAAVSIPSNIAEGQGRNTTGEFVHFLNVSNGSRQEAETQIIIADRLSYLDSHETQRLLGLSEELGRINSGLVRSLLGRPTNH